MNDLLIDLLSRLFNRRCPACAIDEHEQCTPHVPWLCACTTGACLTRLLTPHPRRPT